MNRTEQRGSHLGVVGSVVLNVSNSLLAAQPQVPVCGLPAGVGWERENVERTERTEAFL